MNPRIAALPVLWLLAFVPVPAADDISGDRPDFTDSPLAVPRGSVQLEAGMTATDAGDVDVVDVGEALLRIGLVEPLELRLGLGSYVRVDDGESDPSGYGGQSVGVKWTLRRSSTPRATDVGILAFTTLPPGDDDVFEDAWQPGAILALGWDLTERLSLGTNAGYVRARADGDRFNQLLGSVSLSGEVGENVGLFVEVFGFNRERPESGDAILANTGAVFRASGRWLVDLRVGTGFGDSEVDLFVGAGLVTRW